MNKAFIAGTYQVLMHLMAQVLSDAQWTFKNAQQFCRLNAPYGARCFLTDERRQCPVEVILVLMHLMALGAF